MKGGKGLRIVAGSCASSERGAVKQQVDCLTEWNNFGTMSAKVPAGWAEVFGYVDGVITMARGALKIEAATTVVTASNSEGECGSVGALVTAYTWPTERDRGTMLGRTWS